jgi:hypothetical protein
VLPFVQPPLDALIVERLENGEFSINADRRTVPGLPTPTLPLRLRNALWSLAKFRPSSSDPFVLFEGPAREIAQAFLSEGSVELIETLPIALECGGAFLLFRPRLKLLSRLPDGRSFRRLLMPASPFKIAARWMRDRSNAT